MLFLTKRRLARITNRKENLSGKSYWAIVKREFFNNRLAVWSLRMFYVLLFLALMADFLANERPLYCHLMVEQEPVLLSELEEVTINTVDTLELALNASIPTRKTKSKRDKSIEEGNQTSLRTTTKTQTITYYTSLGQGDSTQLILVQDSIKTKTTEERIDSVPTTYFPVLRQYLVDWGLATWDEKFVATKWLEQDYISVVFPPITYSPTTRDAANGKFKSPFGDQVFEEGDNRGWHYLGTDRIGQDVASGMLHGTRTAMLVGIVAMSIALLIGILLGALSGYFGDDRFWVTPLRLVLNLLAVLLAFFYTFVTHGYTVSDSIANGGLLWAIGILLAHLVGLLLAAHLVSYLLEKVPFLSKKIALPLDLIIMRFIEVVNSIPLLVLILAIVGIVEEPSVLFVMVIIGLVSWTSIAKFVRAELLRIRSLEYIEAAQALGYSEWRTITRHALPNALAPVLIAVAFGIATAILTEAFLSFIGVGIPDDQVTWGSLLRLSQDKFSAWWLAIFPGLAIFITVTIFNLIGEGLTDALDPRQRQ